MQSLAGFNQIDGGEMRQRLIDHLEKREVSYVVVIDILALMHIINYILERT
jgi:hypothetical protein